MAAFTTHIEENGLIYHTADTLALPGLAHGFSTRAGGVSRGVFGQLNLGLRRGDSEENVLENYRIFCAALHVDRDRCVLSRQIHRDDVKIVTESDAGAGLIRPQDYEADALVTNVPGLSLVIFPPTASPRCISTPSATASARLTLAGAARPWALRRKPSAPWPASTGQNRKTSAPPSAPASESAALKRTATCRKPCAPPWAAKQTPV